MICTPKVRQTEGVYIFMGRKKKINAKYSPEFKISVIMDMRKNHLGYMETVRKYWGKEINANNYYHRVQRWERIYLEEGEAGFYIERRGRTKKVDNPNKGRPRKKPLGKKIREDLIAENQRLKEENQYLKAEMEYLKKLDIVFPVLHGLYGEDGTIQGMLELIKIPYVGAKVLSSSICMDKAYSKIIFDKANIPQAEYIYLRKYMDKYIYIEKDFSEEILTIDEIVRRTLMKIKFPMFVKPSNSGSSVGISRVENEKELIKAIKYAGKFDNKILIEESLKGREIECAVLGNEDIETSCLGEIISGNEFYSFNAKYQNEKSKTIMPADLPEELSNKVRNIAKKAYKATDCKGLARVDFFVDDKNNKIYINEINTIPGFTQISMYPKLWEQMGINYSELLDKLIELAYIKQPTK